MRYVPYIVVGVIGFGIAVAGLLALGIGAFYGGLTIAIVAPCLGYADRLSREDPRTR